MTASSANAAGGASLCWKPVAAAWRTAPEACAESPFGARRAPDSPGLFLLWVEAV